MNELAEFLRAKRKKRGLTCEEVGKLMNGSSWKYRQYEVRRIPSDSACENIAAALKLNNAEKADLFTIRNKCMSDEDEVKEVAKPRMVDADIMLEKMRNIKLFLNKIDCDYGESEIDCAIKVFKALVEEELKEHIDG